MATRFVDARGTEWEVWEVGGQAVPADVSPARARASGRGMTPGAWLYFESATQRRRLARYPGWWQALGDQELAELCDAAERDRPPRVPGYEYADLDLADAW